MHNGIYEIKMHKVMISLIFDVCLGWHGLSSCTWQCNGSLFVDN
jgi:hypothetical protein